MTAKTSLEAFTIEYEYQETDEEYKQLQRLIAKLRRQK